LQVGRVHDISGKIVEVKIPKTSKCSESLT
jgi:hypothetical protein